MRTEESFNFFYNLNEWGLQLSATFYICIFACIESVEQLLFSFGYVYT